MHYLQRFVIGLTAFCFVASCEAPQTTAPTRTDREALYAWFDTLGYQAILTGQFIRVDYLTGAGTMVPERATFGFLVGTKPNGFTFLNVGLYKEDFPQEFYKTEYHAAGLDQWTSHLLGLKAPKGKDPMEYSGEESILSNRASLFVLSRACSARGLTGAAASFYARSQAEDRSELETRQPYPLSIRNLLAEHARNTLLGDLGDLKVSWDQLANEFKSFESHYPDTTSAIQTRMDSALVTQIADSRRNHAAARAEAVAKLSVRDRISELIFQLPDQNGHQVINPGYCGVFQDPRGEASPAAQLANLGLPAVPQLIDALTDDRISRSRTIFRATTSPTNPSLRVRVIALRILEKIASQDFDKSDGDQDFIELPRVPEIKAAVRSWFEKISAVGEKQTLINGIAKRQGWDIYPQMERLAEAYPKDAIAPIVRAITNPKHADQRASLLRLLTKNKLPVSNELVTNFLLHGSTLEIRLAALDNLLQSNREHTLDWLIHECRQTQHQVHTNSQIHVADVTQILADSGRPDAIDLLQSELGVADADERFDIIQDVGPDSTTKGMANSKRFSQAVEKLLTTQLLDTHICSGGWQWGDLDDSETRVCEAAAHALAHCFPTKYSFVMSDSIPLLDHQRFADLNKWRAEQSMPPLSVPVRRIAGVGQACRVSRVSLTGSPSTATNIALAARLLKNTVLTETRLNNFLKEGTSHWPPALRCLKILAERDSYGDGVTLTIDFAKKAASSNDWDGSESYVLGFKSIASDETGGSEPRTLKHAALAKIFAADPYECFEINVSISHKA
jgi:hypothetical protein